jgi:hypothetical protein
MDIEFISGVFENEFIGRFLSDQLYTYGLKYCGNRGP